MAKDHVTGKAAHQFSGPATWALCALVGALLGLALTGVLPPRLDPAGRPQVELVLVAPFALLLLLIATMPLIHERLWHVYFPDAAFFLGSTVVAYYVAGYGHHGREQMLHAAREYYSFIALVGGLYVVSGGILTDIRGRGRPWSNTLILAIGAMLANVVGTTGASVLLIRPFIRLNRGRLRPMHVLFFIFIVSNCGGCLTPIGDPPLYLGYLKGVPFAWTFNHLLLNWLVTVGPLLAMFFAVDSYFERIHSRQGVQRTDPPEAELHRHPHGPPVTLRGWVGFVSLVLIVAGVFIDPLLQRAGWTGHFPVGATFQIGVAAAAYFFSERELYTGNEFSFFPVKEVGLLFLGIFATMVPALGYLAAHGPELNVRTPTQFYFLTGILSAVLDNAPTYMTFLQLAVGETELTKDVVHSQLLAGDGALVLAAISTGAVFFGAMTYIGNGPNFMVRSIAQSAGVKMPSFLGYAVRAGVLLFPVLVVHWWLLIAVPPLPASFPARPGNYSADVCRCDYSVTAHGSRSERRIDRLFKNGEDISGALSEVRATPIGRFAYLGSATHRYNIGWLNTTTYDGPVFGLEGQVLPMFQGYLTKPSATEGDGPCR